MQYRVLGPLEVARDDVPIDLGGPKQRAVLAVLLTAAPRVVPTDELVDAVWGAHPPLRFTNSLQAYVSNLRKILRDDATATSPIVRQLPGYRLDVAGDQVDAVEFRTGADLAQEAVRRRDWAGAADAASRALALWRGPLLADLRDEEWVRVAAATPNERRHECVEDLVTALLGLGRTASALTTARELHAAQPLRERACWLLMVALYRDGRTAEALDVYREHVARLDDELGLEPGAALRDLQGAVLRQDLELLDWPGAAAATIPGIVEPADRLDRDRPHEDAGGFVGRTRELAMIDAMVADPRPVARWLLLRGPAGIGKTRLADEALRRADAAGYRVVRSLCPEDDAVPPWWPVRQVLRALGADADSMLAVAPGADADHARFAAYERIRELFARAAPLALSIDDIQWSDATSLRFLTHLVAAASDVPLVVVLTARDGVSDPELHRLFVAVARQQGTRQIDVPPLGVGEVAELMRRVSGEATDDVAAQELTSRTGGNPFFVSEYARLPSAERTDIPLAVRSVLGRRLEALDPAVLQVLRVAAVVGDPLDIGLLLTLTRLDADALADLLDEASDERIIVTRTDSRSYGFAHGLLREQVLAGMSDVRLRRLHANVAAAVPPDQLGRRASHLVAALPLVDPAEAYAACRVAAVDADERWYSDAAARWWEAALEVFDQLPTELRSDSERDDLLVARVDALARAGRGATALGVIDAAVVDAAQHGRTRSVGRLASTLLRTTGAWPWAVYRAATPAPLLARLAEVESLLTQDPAARAQVLAALAVGSVYSPDPMLVDRLSGQAIELAERGGDADALADALLGRALAFSGIAQRAEETVALLDRLAALPHPQERIDDVIRHGIMTMACATLGQRDRFEEHVRLGIHGSDELRLPVSRVQFRWLEGMVAAWHGELDAAAASYQRAWQTHNETELYIAGVHWLSIAAVRWLQGRLGDVDSDIPDDADAAGWEQVAIAAARGRPDVADGLIAATLAADRPVSWVSLGRATVFGHVVADLGLDHHAPRLIDELEPLRGYVAIVGTSSIIGPAALALARLYLLLGDRTEAARSLAIAEELAQRIEHQSSVLRARIVRAELDGVFSDIEAIADEADAAGLFGVARDARRLRPS